MRKFQHSGMTRIMAAGILASSLGAATLVVQILDENGAPTAARVYLIGSDGKGSFPPHAMAYRKTRGAFSEEHFVPPKGSFDIELRAGSYRITIERGKEYLPVQAGLTLAATDRVEKTFRLERWVRMSGRGWYSADMHAHRPLRDLAALMEAEDLNAAVPITRWRAAQNTIREDEDLRTFLSRGAVHFVSPLRWFPVLGEELEPPHAALLASALGSEGTSLEYPLANYGRRARARGALVDSEKATSLELPAVAALRGCDLVGLANNHFWRSGYYTNRWGVWPDHTPSPQPANCAGFARAGFEIYYALLNMGFPLKLSAGSASGVHPVPIGWSRIYTHIQGDFTPSNWYAALRAGRSFVTTGPLLLLRVDGHEPGEEFVVRKLPASVTAEVEMLSIKPVTAAEIVLNGSVQSIRLRPEERDRYTYRGRTRLSLQTSSWIAARWLATRAESCDVAHSAPVYVRQPDSPIPVPRREAEYLLGRIDKLIGDAKPTPELEEARRVYAAKLQQSR